MAELKNNLLPDSDDDRSDHPMPSKGAILQLEQKDAEAMTQHLNHERQVWLKLSLAAIRSAKSMEIASNDQLHALAHRWMEIRLLLTIETLRRDAHAYSRAHQPTTHGAPIRSILALEHFPRPAVKPSPGGRKGSKKATSSGTGRHATAPAAAAAAAAASSSASSLHKRPPHTAWEGTVYRHKLLTSLHYKLSLKLVWQALQLHAQQSKQRRRMLTSIPTLRQQKLRQVTFLALVQTMVEARYLQRRSDAQATQFLLQRHVQTPFRLWHRRVHHQLPQWRRLQYAALTYRRYRRLQLAWQLLRVRLLRRRRMRQWQVAYCGRSRQLRAWLAWRCVWQQKDAWRASLYARYTGGGGSGASVQRSRGPEAAQGLSAQAAVARYRDRQRQWRQPAYAGIHQFPAHRAATARSDSRHSRSRGPGASWAAGDAPLSPSPSPSPWEEEDDDVASRRSVFDSAKRSRFASGDSVARLAHSSQTAPSLLRFPSTLSPLTPATAKSRRATRFTFSPPGSPVAAAPRGGASSSSSSFRRSVAASSAASAASAASQRSRLIEDVLSRTSQDALALLHRSSPTAPQPQPQQPQPMALSPRAQQQLAALLDRVPDDDVDPLHPLTAAQREAVHRLVQQRRSAWYFRQCRAWFGRVLSAAHRRRCGRRLAHAHRAQRLQRRWRQWRRLWQQWQQQHALCDAIYARRWLATVFGAWRDGFAQRFHVHRHVAELLCVKRTKRRLRRCWRHWRTLQRERDVVVRARAAVVAGLLRRVVGGWRSVVGRARYLRTAARVVVLRRVLRPMFATWRGKCRNKRLLRRVFTVQEQCWAVRRSDASLDGRRALATAPPAASFAHVYQHFHAWATVVRTRRRQRWEDRHQRLALCFRGATLLARHFVAWRDVQRVGHRRRQWQRRWQQRRLQRSLAAWRGWLVEVERPRRALAVAAWQRAAV
eukprot:gene10267-7290_t